ncbi:hypothetical protein DL767_006463 [Monosporascus sp. MG133]|nr:hypothetical protein DL767_006463 [Monosporascus sp. MG133]
MSRACCIFPARPAGWNIPRIGAGMLCPQQPAQVYQDGGGARGEPGGAPELGQRREHPEKPPRSSRDGSACAKARLTGGGRAESDAAPENRADYVP